MKPSIHTAKRAKNRKKADFLATLANLSALAWGQIKECESGYRQSL
jgi:hypothetical protein